MTVRTEEFTPSAPSTLRDQRRIDLTLHVGLLLLTWALMILGALTRASSAGISCPDWPLCHGYVIPPLDVGRYPVDPHYAVYKVYLEFLHRVLAGLVSIGSIALGLRLIRAKRVRHAIALWVVLALQVAMGGVTVILRNAPFTVVIHLALALTFTAVLIHSGRTVLGFEKLTGFRVSYAIALGLVFVQLLIGAVVSSRSIGLACMDFPLCNGLPIPAYWTGPIAWQMTHRVTGYSIFFIIAGIAAFSRLFDDGAAERTRSLALVGLVCVQILLGGLNVWFQIPPLASAAHLGVAVLIFATLVDRNVRATS